MYNLSNVKLRNILPPNLLVDPDMMAAASSLDESYWVMVDEAEKNLLIYPNVDNLSSEVIDHLAWYLHVDFYDSTAPIEKRKALVKGSIKWHMRKGTPSAVEEMISAAFEYSKVIEWFEYDGEPYMFKILTTDRIPGNEKLEELRIAIETVKNRRSWLESFAVLRENKSSIKMNFGIRKAKTIRIKFEGGE